LHTGASGMAALSAVGSLPYLLLAVPAGAWVDARGRRRITMIGADIGRFLLLATVAAGSVLGWLTLPLLLLLWFLTATCSVFFRVAASTLFVSLVPRERYVEANGLLQTSQATAFFIGPGLGGLLIQLLTAPVALLADALSFLVSALSLASIRPPEPPPTRRHKGHTLAGLWFIRTSPLLRSSYTAAATFNFFRSAFTALYILYGTRTLHVTPTEWGLILGPSSVGAMAAATLTGRVTRRLGLGRTLIWATLLSALPNLLVPLAGGTHVLVVALLFLAEGLATSGAVLRVAADGTIQAARIPDAVRARVSAAFVTGTSGLRPLGALLAGVLAAWVGVHTTLWIAAIGGSLSFLWLLSAPMRTLGQVDEAAGMQTG
jgi:MFS family permease